MKEKIFKYITRAMEDTRGLDEKYPNKEDSVILSDTLNMIAEDCLEKILKIVKDGNHKN